jgi:hypothetical protein
MQLSCYFQLALFLNEFVNLPCESLYDQAHICLSLAEPSHFAKAFMDQLVSIVNQNPRRGRLLLGVKCFLFQGRRRGLLSWWKIIQLNRWWSEIRIKFRIKLGKQVKAWPGAQTWQGLKLEEILLLYWPPTVGIDWIYTTSSPQTNRFEAYLTRYML